MVKEQINVIINKSETKFRNTLILISLKQVGIKLDKQENIQNKQFRIMLKKEIFLQKIQQLKNFMTSPFLRCIQTSVNLMREIPNNSKLYIQDEIGEWMSTFDFDSDIQKDIHIRTKQHPNFNQEYQNGVQIIQQKLFNSQCKQASFPESEQACFKRVNTFVQQLVDHMNKDQNKNNTINICVTHQGLVEFVLQGANQKNYEYVDYCGVAQLILEENNKIKVGINGKSFWQ